MRLNITRSNGLTLIELIVSILIMSVGLLGIMSVFSLTAGKNVNPLIQKQALAIAQSYMNEILSQAYSGGVATGRSNYTNIDNYNGLTDYGAKNQDGVSIIGLSRYTVSVAVSAPQTLTGGVEAKSITVKVLGPGAIEVTLVGYRTNY